MCVFSAANEVAVAAFLAREIRFTEIDVVIANALEAVNLSEPQSLDAVQALDKEARSAAAEAVAQIASLRAKKRSCDAGYAANRADRYRDVLYRCGGSRVWPFLGCSQKWCQSASLFGGLWAALIRWRGRDEVEYVIAILPLGGYVRMADEREGNVADEDLPRAYNRQPVARRMAIAAAGQPPIFYWQLWCCGCFS